jgi:hypothetical protein
VIKRVFGFNKVRYRGLAKNANRVFATAALANVFLLRHWLVGAVRRSRRSERQSRALLPGLPCKPTRLRQTIA